MSQANTIQTAVIDEGHLTSHSSLDEELDPKALTADESAYVESAEANPTTDRNSLIIAAISVIALGIWSYLFYNHYKKKQDPTGFEAASSTTASILAALQVVGAIVLPLFKDTHLRLVIILFVIQVVVLIYAALQLPATFFPPQPIAQGPDNTGSGAQGKNISSAKDANNAEKVIKESPWAYTDKAGKKVTISRADVVAADQPHEDALHKVFNIDLPKGDHPTEDPKLWATPLTSLNKGHAVTLIKDVAENNTVLFALGTLQRFVTKVKEAARSHTELGKIDPASKERTRQLDLLKAEVEAADEQAKVFEAFNAKKVLKSTYQSDVDIDANVSETLKQSMSALKADVTKAEAAKKK